MSLQIQDEANWDTFDPDEYLGHNYAASVLPEDQRVLDHIVERIEALRVQPRTMKRAANVGHGGAFHAETIIQHLLHDNGQLELIENGGQNLLAMQRTISRGLAGDKGIWEKFEKHISMASPSYKNGLERAYRLAKIVPGSIHELEKGAYDAGFTFYCPESITQKIEVFEHAVLSFLDSIKPDGLIVMAFVRGSEGYDTPGDLFPAVPVECEDVYALLKDNVRQLEVIPIRAPHGIRPADGPQYAGIGLATGIKR